MLQYPNFDPIALTLGPVDVLNRTIGPLEVHWYGVAYMLAFLSAWLMALYRSRSPHSVVLKNEVENLITYGAFGVIIGGRLGYVLMYSFERWMSDPLWLFRIWEGGMSFHGGLVGVIVAMVIYANRIRVPFLDLMDFVAPLIPIGLGFGRIGNFIGQELWGRVSDAPWAMVFPRAADAIGVARHPSQLYQAALEGVVLSIIVIWFSAKPKPRGAVSGLFLVCYATFRALAENYREPDAHIGFDLFGSITRGQLLSAPMFVIGFGLLIYAFIQYKKSAPKSEGAIQEKSVL